MRHRHPHRLRRTAIATSSGQLAGPGLDRAGFRLLNDSELLGRVARLAAGPDNHFA